MQNDQVTAAAETFAARRNEARENIVSELATRWPLGSAWTHSSIGRVRVVDHSFGDNSHEPALRVTGSVDIVDSAGKRWTCYAPAVDLAPVADSIDATL